MAEGSADITRLLQAWSAGDHDAGERLTALLMDELKVIVRHKMRQLDATPHQTTELLHDLYIRLMDTRVDWESRGHFFGICSRLMRQILVDQYRIRNSQKRGGSQEDVSLEPWMNPEPDDALTIVDLADLDRALAAFEKIDPARAKVVEMRFFCGFTVTETADILGVSEPTVKRHFKVARIWLKRYLQGDES